MNPITYLQTTDISLAALIGYVEEKQVESTRSQKLSDYESLVRSIVGQQISTSAARSIFDRLLGIVDGVITPESITSLTEESLRTTGLSRQKISYIQGMGNNLIEGTVDLGTLYSMSDAEAVNMLKGLRGIGEWTAQCYLLGCMSRIDAWPSSDLGLQVAIQRLKGLKTRPQKLTTEEIAEIWKPFRSIAALILWSSYD